MSSVLARAVPDSVSASVTELPFWTRTSELISVAAAMVQVPLVSVMSVLAEVVHVYSRLPLKPTFELTPVIDMEPSVIATAPTFLTMTVILGLAFVSVLAAATNNDDSIDIDDWAAWFCEPCCEPVASEVCARKPWLHMKMITLIATATATISSVAKTGATAFLLRL